MRRKAEFLGLGAFDSEVQERLVKGLLDSQVSRAGYVSDLLEQLIRPRAIAFQIVTDDLNVDGRRQPEVQNLSDDIRRQKGEHHTRELLRQAQSKFLHISIGGMMLGRQSHQNVRVRGADWS